MVLMRLWREKAAKYAVALFDRPEPTFRKKSYEEYKAGRPPAPDELVAQLVESRALFAAFGIGCFELAGFEADDLIATLTERFLKQNLGIVILTGDLDTLQLVRGESVVVWAFRRGITAVTRYDEKAVAERYGISPRKLLDYKALVGDQSDNIPGVPGIGPKTAAELVRRWGSLEKIYRAAEKDEKLGRRLAPFRDQAFFAKKLIALRGDVPLPPTPIEKLAFSPDPEKAANYLRALGFNSLVKRLVGKGAEETGGDVRKSGKERKHKGGESPIQGALFSAGDF
jgi:DNA polymerase-1